MAGHRALSGLVNPVKHHFAGSGDAQVSKQTVDQPQVLQVLCMLDRYRAMEKAHPHDREGR